MGRVQTILRCSGCWARWVLLLVLCGLVFPGAYRHSYVKLPAARRDNLESLTIDGLHLNQEGCARLASVRVHFLPTAPPSHARN